MYIHIFSLLDLPSHCTHHRAQNWASCALQQVPTSYLFDTCTPVFIAALFILDRTWKQSKCPITGEQIKKKMQYIYTVEYQPQKGTKSGQVCRDTDEVFVIQSEVKSEKNKCHILTRKCGIQKNGTDEPIPRAGIEAQTQRIDMQTRYGGGERVGHTGRLGLKTAFN